MAQRGSLYGRPENTPIEQPITPRPSQMNADNLSWYAPPAYSPANTSSSCALANHSYTPPPSNIGTSIAHLRLKAQEYNNVMQHNPYAHHQMPQWLDGRGISDYNNIQIQPRYDPVQGPSNRYMYGSPHEQSRYDSPQSQPRYENSNDPHRYETSPIQTQNKEHESSSLSVVTDKYAHIWHVLMVFSTVAFIYAFEILSDPDYAYYAFTSQTIIKRITTCKRS